MRVTRTPAFGVRGSCRHDNSAAQRGRAPTKTHDAPGRLPPSSAALPNITSFPRKRESTGPTMGPRLRGDDDADFHGLGWAASPRVLP